MSYIWNRGGQPLIGAPAPPPPPNTNQNLRGIITPQQQLDLRHYTPGQIRNLQAAYAGGGGGGGTLNPKVTINASQSVASMTNISLQGLGGDVQLSQYLSSAGSSGATVTGAGWTYTGTIATPPSGVGNTLRFGIITDPVGSRPVFYGAGRASDPVTFGFPHIRVQHSFDQTAAGYSAKSGTTYWYTYELFMPAQRWSGNSGPIWDVHNTNPSSTSTGPWEAGIDPASSIFPNPNVFCAFIQQPVVPGGFTEYYPWASDNNWSGTPSSFGQSWSSWPYPQGTWVKHLVKYRGDPTGSTGIFQYWIGVGASWMQVVNLTGLTIGTNDGPSGFPDDYIKVGWDELSAPTNGEWVCWRSAGFYQDNSNVASDFQLSSAAYP